MPNDNQGDDMTPCGIASTADSPAGAAMPDFWRQIYGPDAPDTVFWDSWAVRSTGNREQDFRLGVAYAERLIFWARSRRRPELVISSLYALIGKARQNGGDTDDIDAAFLARLARFAYAGGFH